MEMTYKIFIKKEFYEILAAEEISAGAPVHIHSRNCAGKILSGEKTLVINGKNRLLKKDDLFYIPAFTPHSCFAGQGSHASYLVLCINDISKITEEMLAGDLLILPEYADDVMQLFNLALTEQSRITKNNNRIISRMVEYISENYSEKLSVDFLAGIAGLNKYYLLHLFKQEMGIPLHQFIILTRIKMAKTTLIDYGNMPDAALNCGFYDQSHCIRNFKKIVGLAPRKYAESVVRL